MALDAVRLQRRFGTGKSLTFEKLVWRSGAGTAAKFDAFEDDLNRKLKSKTLKMRVIYLPVGRDEIISRLVEGWGDVIFADLTITPERQKMVDFSVPMYPLTGVARGPERPVSRPQAAKTGP